MPNQRLSRRHLLRCLSASSALMLSSGLRANVTVPPLFRNPKIPIPLRVADLMGRMTIAEKAAQIIDIWQRKREIYNDALGFDAAKASKAYPDGLGQIARPSDYSGAPKELRPKNRWREPRDVIAFVNAAQTWSLTRTRLGIPIIFHEEALHGYMARGGTCFPQAIGLASAFDPDLVERVNAVIAAEARAHGATLALSPVVDIARDPRWGRIEETFGEDPFLCGELGVAAVTGLQGDGEVIAPDKVIATLKHMTGHGQPQAGANTAPAPFGERELRERFFPPFRAVVARTKIGAVMPSYNEIDGVPSHANHWMLDTVLRKEWKFDGVIIGDYMAISELATLHGIAKDQAEAARLALAAGVDSDSPDGEAYRTLPGVIAAGQLSASALDEACRRILTLKFRAGLFERPYVDPAASRRLLGNTTSRALALEAARKSLVLLSNDGTLPLDTQKQKRIAVIGPNAAIARLGGYTGDPLVQISLLEGVRKLVGQSAEIVHAQGMFITRSEDRSADEVQLGEPDDNRRLIAEAAALARTADVIVLAIGDTEQTGREAWAKNHLGDRASLDLPGQQNELFDAMKATGKPVVVVAVNGRPPSWPHVASAANAMLECWYPGQEGGTAIAEALFGITNPGGKLPVTVARHVGQVPMAYDAKPTATRGYLFDTTDPLFPFGFGLSYTKFEISPPRLSKSKIARDETVAVEVDVTNTGSRAGDEVVQLYVRDDIASVTQPSKRLRGFKRVTLSKGERHTVRFNLGPADFALWNAEMKEVVEPGTFQIMVGPDSGTLKSIQLEILDLRRSAP